MPEMTELDRIYFLILTITNCFNLIVMVCGFFGYNKIRKLTKSKQLLYLTLAQIGSQFQLLYFLLDLCFSVLRPQIKESGVTYSLMNLLIYSGLYMDAMFLLECINTSLYMCTGSRQIVVPFKKCMSPQSTFNYWIKLNLIILIPFITIYIVQVITTLTGIRVASSILGWLTNMLIVYLNILEMIAAYKFNKYVLDSIFKSISILQIALTVVNALTLSTSNFWFAITDLLSYFMEVDFNYSLMLKNIVYSIGSVIQGVLIIDINIKIKRWFQRMDLNGPSFYT
ncbi:Hypothetical_protein [Hexamita inflata]|uniref:Hypothetical_protein n=1 Tax=Hexamita inflata TaxID=28002 RepID=A0AA86NXJ0_9EUKA|nr:Hypothetical protein HINF_LOCUS14647 [Hexamita inflata]